jgi:hypothetical protein
MSIKRAPRPETRYYVLNKDISEDMRLSWEARGLLIFLLGKPDNWIVSISHLIGETEPCARKKSRRDSIRAIIGELVDLGYMEINQRRSDGTFDGVDYIVKETPSSPPIINGSPKTDNPSSDDTPKTDLPKTDKAAADKAAAENPHLINNDSNQSTDLLVSNDLNQYNEAQNLPSVLPKQKRKKQDDNAVLGDLPDWIPVEPWIGFVEMRKAMGAKGKLTEHAVKLLVADLKKLKEQGQDLTEVINRSIMNNWKGFFAVKQQYSGRQQALEDRNRSAADQFLNGSEW